MNNAIIFCGNTGVGKSYICNRIFQMYGSPTEFKASASINSETGALQHGKITTDGITYTILDTPGFFDTKSPNNRGETDGANMCNFVAALESCEQIFAIVFIFTDRFSEPHMMWFERMVSLVTNARVGNIILLHNKLPSWNLKKRAKNSAGINCMIRSKIQVAGRVEYIGFGWGGDNSQLQCLMAAVTKLVPFRLIQVVVPEICYEKTEISERFKEVISELKKDEGCYKKEVRDTSHYETELEDGKRPREKIAKTYWVESFATDTVWAKKEVLYRVVATYCNVY